MFEVYLFQKAALNTKVQTCFSFGNKEEARSTIICIRNDACDDCRFAHQGLLTTFPSIRMSKNDFSICLHIAPQIDSGCMCFFNVPLSALMEILQEIGEDLNSGFSFRQGWDRLGHMCRGSRSRTEVKLEPT